MTAAHQHITSQLESIALESSAMTDNSPEYFEKLAEEVESRWISIERTTNALRAAAALARENAELRLDREAVGKYLEEIRAYFGWQNEPRDGLSKRILERIESAESANRALQDEVDRLRVGYEQIAAWTKAYPVAVFPEPDWKKAAAALKNVGLTLDAVSASNMRHVITRVHDIAIAYTGTEPQD